MNELEHEDDHVDELRDDEPEVQGSLKPAAEEDQVADAAQPGSLGPIAAGAGLGAMLVKVFLQVS